MQNKNQNHPKSRTSHDTNLIVAHTEFANFHEGYVRSYITLADTKAAVVFALTSSVIAYLFSSSNFHALLFRPTSSLPTALAYGTSIAFVLSAALAAWVIVPRTPHTGEGLVFFGAVRNYPTDEAYVRAVRESTESELTQARLRHCYNVSTVCWRKYRALKWAIWFSVLGLALLLVTLAFTEQRSMDSAAPTSAQQKGAPPPKPINGNQAIAASQVIPSRE